MKITILGASRGVGRAAVKVAVDRGHAVTAVARSMSSAGPAARVVTGDVLDPAVVSNAIADADAVLVALGTRPGEKSTSTQGQICSRATRAVLAAMSQSGTRRIVVVSSYGVGPTRSQRPFPFNLVAATLLKYVMADKELQEREVRASGVDWTIVQPLGLTDDAASGTPFISTNGKRESTQISRADVAVVCIDVIESQASIHESIAISARRTAAV